MSEAGALLHLETGQYLMVHRVTRGSGVDRQTFFPLREAYARNVHKAQGLELPHATVHFDVENPAPGVGYVAVSRTGMLEALAFLGRVIATHFQPNPDWAA